MLCSGCASLVKDAAGGCVRDASVGINAVARERLSLQSALGAIGRPTGSVPTMETTINVVIIDVRPQYSREIAARAILRTDPPSKVFKMIYGFWLKQHRTPRRLPVGAAAAQPSIRRTATGRAEFSRQFGGSESPLGHLASKKHLCLAMAHLP